MAKKSKPHKEKLFKAIFQARYKPELIYHDKLFSIHEVIDTYPHWFTDKISVVLRDFNRQCSLSVSSKSFSFDQDSDSLENEEMEIVASLSKIPNFFGIPSFNRLGLRRHYLIHVSMSFDELVQVLSLKLFTQEKAFKKVMPNTLKDFHYRADFTEKDFQLNLMTGPIKRDEIQRWINFTKEHHLDPEKNGEDYLQYISKYPDVAVYIDIDVSRSGDDISIDEALPFYFDARKRINETVEGLKDYFLR